MKTDSAVQLSLIPETQNLPDAFRRLYYHLYSNSEASRAERISEALSLLLLVKLAVEEHGDLEAVRSYREGRVSADEALLPLLRRNFPGLLEDQQRFTLSDKVLRPALAALDEITLTAAPAHVIGDAFQALIGPRLRGDKGQFFTPKSLVRAMVEVIDPTPNESVLDPACGTGGFLVATHAHQVARATGPLRGHLVGVDKDEDLARLARALLRIATRERATIHTLNSLDLRAWPGTTERLFDVVLTNPPFGARIQLRDKAILAHYELARRWIQSSPAAWSITSDLNAGQDPQILFVELCVRKLKPGGRMGIVLPEGMFGNSSTGYIWEWLERHGRIMALIDCPRTTFQPSTDTKTNVLFFQKHKNGDGRQKLASYRVRVGVAVTCGHDRRGRTSYSDGKPHTDDLVALGSTYHRNAPTSNWHRVRITNRDYVVPRYYVDAAPSTPHESRLIRGARTATLSDLVAARHLTIRKGHEVGSDAYGTGDVPFVRTSDITNFEISVDPTKSVSEAVYSQYAGQQRLQPGDVLIAVDGRYRIGATALVTSRNVKCVVQSHFRILGTPDREELGPYELLFALNLPSVRQRLRNLVFVQSTLGTLGSRLLELRIPLLVGDGPWREAVEKFRRLLQARDECLAELRMFTGSEVEL